MKLFSGLLTGTLLKWRLIRPNFKIAGNNLRKLAKSPVEKHPPPQQKDRGTRIKLTSQT
jgi:hypothetical protein